MIDISTLNILITLLVVITPLFGLLAKDGAILFRNVKKAMEDGKLTDDEIDLILKDAGVILRSIVRLVEKFITK